MTTDNLGQKARHLNVNPIHALTCNSVSETVASEMAIHACSLFSSDWPVAMTGYAAPLPEREITNLYAFFYAIAFRDKVRETRRMESVDLGAIEVQVFYACEVLRSLDSICIRKGDRPE